MNVRQQPIIAFGTALALAALATWVVWHQAYRGGVQFDIAAASTHSFSYSLDLNHASLGQIMALPGIGETMATRIVEYREQVGGFSSIDDLLKVSGIGPKTLAAIESHVHVAYQHSKSLH